MLTIRLLGAVQFILDGEEIQVPRRKSRALLCYLAEHGRPVQREQFLSLLWTDLPRASALQTLRTTLYGLNKLFGAALEVQSDQVALAPESQVDARLFERQLEADITDDDALEQALELYHGDFLADFSLPDSQAFEDWLTVTREHYRRLAVRGWTGLAERYETRREYRQALDSLDRALRLNPLQEDLQRDSIRLLYLAGDRPGAILRYDELRRLLDEEMGVPPMAETRALYDAIVTDRLALPAGQTPPASRRAKPQTVFRTIEPVDELPFTGRAAELAELRQMLQVYPMILIEGEPGVGKTRLAQEFLRREGRLVLVGRGRELEQALPYHPFIEALRDLLAQTDWPDLQADMCQEVPTVWLAEVSRLLPELAGAFGAAAAGLPADEARLWEGIHQFILALARRKPLAVFIDDLHWADAATLGLLGYLARQVGDASVRLLATLRPIEPRPALIALLQMSRRENRLAELELNALSQQDIRQISGRLSPTFAEPLADWLFRFSEGNAYFLVELVRHARRTNLLLPDGVLDLNALSDQPVVPQSIYSLIQSRLLRLSSAARRVLDAAVAQGREFDFEVVAQAAGLSENAALDAVDELETAGLVSPLEGHTLRFDHTLTMEVAYRDVGELRHRLLHRRVAEALESLNREHTGQVAGQLAWHFSEGESPVRAARYALQAGDRAISLAAWSEARDFYEMALRGLSDTERLPALNGLAEALSRSGNYARACEVLHDALAVAEATQADPGQIESLQLALARSLMPQARYAEVIELAEKVRSSDLAESAAAAEMLWGMALSLKGEALDVAAEHLLKAQELWGRCDSGSPSYLSQTQFELGNVFAQQGDLAQAVSFYRQALETANRAGEDETLDQRILALNNLGYHLHLLADPAALEYAQAGLKLAQEKGVLGLQAYLYSTLGEIHLAAGDLEKAQSYFQQGLRLAQRFSVQERVAGLTANLGLVAARRGETNLAIHQLSLALGQADALGTRHLAAQVRLWLAPLLPPGQARQLLAQARAIAQDGGRKRLLEEIERLEQGISEQDRPVRA